MTSPLATMNGDVIASVGGELFCSLTYQCRTLMNKSSSNLFCIHAFFYGNETFTKSGHDKDLSFTFLTTFLNTFSEHRIK